MKTILTLLLLYCICLSLTAQEKVNSLTIGDRCPDFNFSGVLNNSKASFRLSDFKGKLVILDFMATNCAGCIEAFPHLQELQKTFSDNIQIIVVAKNNKEQWEKLAKKVRIARELKLPLILNDTLLSSYFPYEYLPHEVWLDSSLEVKAITSSKYVTASNIQLVVEGKTPDWPVKKDIGDYSFLKTLLKPREEQYLNGPLYYSTLTGYRQGTRSMSKMIVDSINKVVRWTVINQPAKILYRYAVERFGTNGIPANRFIYELKHTAKFFSDSSTLYKENWDKKYTWCYELVMSLYTSKQELQNFMLNDLNRYTAYYGRIEKRKFTCYVITCADNDLKASTNFPVDPVSEMDYLRFDTYTTVEDYVNELNSFSKILPVIDETANSQYLNIRVPKSTGANIEEIKKVLWTYGLKITKAERELKAFVISDK